MSERSTSKRAPAEGRETAGILASLPKTRPQRPSAHRARSTPKPPASESTAPRARASVKTSVKTTTGKRADPKTTAAVKRESTPKRTTAAKTRTAPKRHASKAVPVLAPRQGFEVGSEVEQGLTVGPPSNLEMAGSVVGLLGEVAQAGAASTGRLLKGALTRLGGR